MRASLPKTLVVAAAWAATAQLASAQYLRGVNVTGPEWGNKTLPGTNNSTYLYPSQQTFEYFAARGFNFIRLANLWERLQPKLGGPLDPTVLGYLKANIASAKAAGIKASLEIHNFGRYTIPGSPCQNRDPWDDKSTACIIDNVYNGQTPVATSDLANFWVRMSSEFKDDDTVLAYDLMNEPHDMGTANWRQITQDVLTAIRGNGDKKLIMIPGDGGSSAPFWPKNHPASWIDDPVNNFWYQAHEYFDYNYSGTYSATNDNTHQTYPSSYDLNLALNADLIDVGVTRLQPFLTWCQTNNVKCYLGEFGVPRDDPRWFPVMDRLLAKLDQAGLPASYWSAGDAWNWYAADKLNVQPLNNFTTDREQLPTLLAHLSPEMFRTASAAGPYGYKLAPGSLVTGFGNGLTASTISVSGSTLPTNLHGAQVQLTDSQSVTTFAPLVYVAPSRIFYQVPSSVASGRVDVQVLKDGTAVSTGVLEVHPLAPVIFTANGSTSGVASAVVRRVKPDGATTYEPVAHYDPSQGKYVATPINFASDSLSLILYGTGFSQLPGTAQAGVSLNGTPMSVTSAGATGQFPGLDQITITLPNSLAGSGSATLRSTLGGIAANDVTIAFK